jgi:hypothetical protein
MAGWRFEGIQCYIYAQQVAGTVPLYRYYNGDTYDHFYTTNPTEGNNAVEHLGYTQEGTPGYVTTQQVAGTVPLLRYVTRGGPSIHFYTTDASEGNNAVEHLGYTQEGTPGFVFSQPQICQPSQQNISPLYRYVNPSRNACHFYTTNSAELIPANGSGQWNFEGILSSGYLYAQQVAGTVPLLRYYNGKTWDHFYTTDPSEGNNMVNNHGYTQEGSPGYVSTQQVAGAVQLLRYYNLTTLLHFYTTDINEGNNAVQQLGYVQEISQAFVFSQPQICQPSQQNISPLYRYCYTGNNAHFYTTDFTELGGGNIGFNPR